VSGQSSGIYRVQRAYFAHAYESGRHGWPTVGVSPMVGRFLRSAKGRGSRALDIGCGEGRHSAAFAQSGFVAVGVDLESKALVRARAALNGSPTRPSFLQANVFALPFTAGTFDVVVDYGCLHHVRRSDTPKYLDQVVPLLKPGGYYLLSCFSTKFKHHAGERRTRDWLVHAGHYDRFFRRADFPAIFGRWFDILDLTEDREGLYVFHNVVMRKRGADRASGNERPGRRARRGV
jgi:SAM-dependent methyltransferase